MLLADPIMFLTFLSIISYYNFQWLLFREYWTNYVQSIWVPNIHRVLVNILKEISFIFFEKFISYLTQALL